MLLSFTSPSSLYTELFDMLIEAFFLLSYFENVYCKDEAVELLRHCTKAPSMKLASCHFEFLCQLHKID